VTPAPGIRIYVDADACPVKEEVRRVAERHGLAVHMVSNKWIRLPDSPLIERVVVAEGPDAADDWIVERVAAHDIVVTGDIPLASRCLEAGARVVGSTGKAFDTDNIGMALAMRDLKAHLRETGEIGGGNAAFSKQDRSRFLQTMEQMVQDSLRAKAKP
jgi:hypothetical protein